MMGSFPAANPSGWLEACKIVVCLVLAGATVNVGIDPSKCIINKLKMDKGRKSMLDRKSGGGRAAKGKFTEEDVQAMQDVD